MVRTSLIFCSTLCLLMLGCVEFPNANEFPPLPKKEKSNRSYPYPDTCTDGEYYVRLTKQKEPDIELIIQNARLMARGKVIAKTNLNYDTIWTYSYSPHYPFPRRPDKNGNVLFVEGYRNLVKLNTDGKKDFCIFIPPNATEYRHLPNEQTLAFGKVETTDPIHGNIAFWILDNQGAVSDSFKVDSLVRNVHEASGYQDHIYMVGRCNTCEFDNKHVFACLDYQGNVIWQKDLDLTLVPFDYRPKIIIEDQYVDCFYPNMAAGKTFRFSHQGDSISTFEGMLPGNYLDILDIKVRGDRIFAFGSTSKWGGNGDAIVWALTQDYEHVWSYENGGKIYDQFNVVDFSYNGRVICKGYSGLENDNINPRYYIRAILDREGQTCY